MLPERSDSTRSRCRISLKSVSRSAGGRVSDPIRTREQIENSWRIKLEAAAQASRLAHERYSQVLEEYNRAFAAPNSPEGPPQELRLALERARSEEAAARAEYFRVLKIFIDLVVHRKLPDAEAV